MKKELLLAGALTLTGAACANTQHDGVYVNDCVNHTATFYMSDKQEFYAGIDDMSFKGVGESDHITFAKEGGSLVLDGDRDETKIIIDGFETDLESPLRIQLTNETQEAILIEDGSQAAMTMTLSEENLAVVSLSWACAK